MSTTLQTSPPQIEDAFDNTHCLNARNEISTLLEQLRDTEVPIKLHTPHGPQITTCLWVVDESGDTLSFSLEAADTSIQALIESDEATAVAYLDSIKLQFELHNLMLIHSATHTALRCSFPQEIFRFQRRNSFRVHPLNRTQPKAILRHPMIAEMQLELRVLDISLGGCALYLPCDVPALTPGIQLNDVRFELDMSTRLTAHLHLHHVTNLNIQAQGARLGCEILSLESEAQRVLQRHIDQNQKQRRLMGAD